MAEGEIRPDQLGSGSYDEEVYSKGLSREDTIEGHIRRTVYFYSKGLWNEFEYSLKIMIPLLPFAIQERMVIPEHNITTQGVEQHYKLFREIQNCLEKDTNMIFKKKFIKTYE